MANENKKISEMTSEEIREKMKPVGLPGLPYPMAMLKKSEKGVMTHDVGVIESAQNPLLLYTDQSIERVNGMLFRQMPIPGMMFMLRDLLTKIAPDSRNRIMTVFGDAAFGKSHLFKLVGNMVHPQGPISVDCGGMNMREIFFRTVIDYGQGVKEQFEKRVSDGKVSQTSLDNLNDKFPGSVVEKDGKKFIDWEAIGKPEQKDDGTGKMVNSEDRGVAQERGAKLLKAIYEKEGIDVQNNAFGIKTVPGEWFESIWTGRPLFLDEFNKSKKGTLDSFQTALQFANGEIDEVTIYNPMAQAGDGDSPKSITVRRDDLRMGWFVGVAGNDASDGDTTQELSVSMLTRLNPMRIGDPEKRDWAHRISQIWTGLPLVTLYNIFDKKVKADPVGFSEFLVDLRQLGLTAAERKAIPPHELYFLRNYQETVQAINQVSTYYEDRLQLSDPTSEKYNQKEYKDLSDEVSANGNNIFVSFRKPIADFNKAIQSTPDVRPAAESALSLNLGEVFRNLDLTAIGKVSPGWHKFGSNMVRAIQEDIANDTIGMPLTNAALITLCETNGIFPPNLKEAKPSKESKPLSDLLKYDPLKDLGGTEELMEVRSVLMACLKNQNPALKKEDDYVIPLDALGRAMKELKEQAVPAKSFVVPNEDLSTVTKDPIVMGQALPNYVLDDPANAKEYNLVDFRTALAALAVPEYAKDNRAHIWPVELDDFLPDEVKKEVAQDKSQAEAMNTLKGKSAIGFDLIVISALNAKKEQVFMYVIEDKLQNKVMVVGPEEISKPLQSELAKNGVQYVVKGDEGSVTTVNEFLADGAKFRGHAGKLIQGNTQNVIEGLIKAFSALCELADVEAGATPDQMTVNKGSTLGLVIHRSKSRPVVFTSIVTPKSAAKR
ncbi:MAG: hypothetical protein EPN97_02855 [Alphaproteobacteria bacterium]|nr:MAG: hypothetical protein EPN97_02855 [Alphaproteobacteria bacterium]